MNYLTSSILHSIFVEKNNENWVFSPASYLEAMSNLAVCLKGENLAELVAAAPNIGEPQAIGLETYNCLLYSAEYRAALNEAVLDTLHSRHGELRSFAGMEVVDIVNRLVYEKTRGKISDLISRDDITEFTKFIILNCVYFKKDWVHEFNEDSYAYRTFKGATKTVKTKFLTKRAWFKYYEGDGYDIAEIPYKDSEVCCYLIVPTTKNLFELFNRIHDTAVGIGAVKNGLECEVMVPPFKTETTIDLVKPTEAAGIKKVFTWNQDWALVDIEKIHPDSLLKVEKIRQKAYIDFTKKGTEATAATFVSIGLISGCASFNFNPPLIKYIVADKPFLYVLARPQEPYKPLFVGVVNQVEGEPSDGTPTFRLFYDGENLTVSGFNDVGLSGVLGQTYWEGSGDPGKQSIENIEINLTRAYGTGANNL